ncbi:MAG: hypothetical protein JF614_06170 [Acidobacteria bacterium]|nr:hypothetical protein [Acidobacteriota bacterium]
MAKRREKDDGPEQDDAHQMRFLLVEKGAPVVEVAVRWGIIALIVFFVTDCIKSLAGLQTAATIGIRFLADVRVSEALAWIFGAGGVGYGMQQRGLRRRDTKQMGSRLRKYEKLIDPGRSSTDLDSQGDYGED